MGKEAGKHVLHAELSYSLMQAIFEVHNQLGPGFTEDIHEEAVACELEACHIPFERQKPVDVFYKDRLVGRFRLDIVVDSRIILELKAVSDLNDLFKQQLLSYLKATNLRLGILVNLGAKRVQSVRIAN